MPKFAPESLLLRGHALVEIQAPLALAYRVGKLRQTPYPWVEPKTGTALSLAETQSRYSELGGKKEERQPQGSSRMIVCMQRTRRAADHDSR